MTTTCDHLHLVNDVERTADGCEECRKEGTRWVHLRRCLVCGHVGCCDSSPGRHARAHWEQTEHPLIESAEPGETWRWCYAHEIYVQGS